MSSKNKFELFPLKEEPNLGAALVFIHGYGGHTNKTWDNFPHFVGLHCPSHNIFTLGYPTTFTPNLFSFWSSDPAIEMVSKLVACGFSEGRLANYEKIAVVAHSMGGLVMQKMLLHDEKVAARISHLIMFGTPNNGVALASRFRFLLRKRSAVNMTENSEFIRELREDWGAKRPRSLKTVVVAGANDRFVDQDTAHEGFPDDERFVVDGDHITMVKPSDSKSLAVKIVLNQLLAGSQGLVPVQPVQKARVLHDKQVDELLGKQKNDPDKIKNLGQEYVDLALTLEKEGNPEKAVEVLRDYLNTEREYNPLVAHSKNTDALGSLGGQLKRIWYIERNRAEAGGDGMREEVKTYPEVAMGCYTDALYHSFLNEDADQIYYQAINVAFGALVWYRDHDLMERAAKIARKHAQATDDSYWKWSTIGEAFLYMGNLDGAVHAYETAVTFHLPGNYETTSFQALTIIEAMVDQNLLSQFRAETLANRLNEIFYSETLGGLNDPGEIELLLTEDNTE